MAPTTDFCFPIQELSSNTVKLSTLRRNYPYQNTTLYSTIPTIPPAIQTCTTLFPKAQPTTQTYTNTCPSIPSQHTRFHHQFHRQLRNQKKTQPQCSAWFRLEGVCGGIGWCLMRRRVERGARDTVYLSWCWDDWVSGGREVVDVLMAR